MTVGSPPAALQSASLLLVDDDHHVLESMADWLRSFGMQVDAESSYAGALDRITARSYDLVLADIRLRDGDGFDLLEQSLRRRPGTQVLLMTGYGTADSAIDAVRAGAFDYLTKPLIDDELVMALERALSQRKVLAENTELKQQLDRKHGMSHIIGSDQRMLRVFDIIESVANTRATVLVTGESGTGKSLIARAIHTRSERRTGPFVEVACGALPENLLESELFGHVAGAFTGATTNKVGKFLQADGGTIFLDEIGTATPAMQVKLLRVLQELAFEAVGGTQTHRVDVRVVLATNEDLAQRVAEGAFRQDLYYRINVINLELPPLRSRPSDIPLLAKRFLEEVREDANRPGVTGFSDEALAAMQRFHWTGNVRELQNVIERAVLLGKGEVIQLSDLPVEMRLVNPHASGSAGYTGQTLKEALEGPERQIILEVLELNGWNRNETADQLGINRTTLYKKMKRLGLEDRMPVS
ncbi:sigma-54-dependent transcriptional regulator [Botrimarina hoheduenensis]|uniref:Transcriptional regulatory protein ZraR n=1 Tax=Botrimarina hoheduenensis TaxID=2528000 RepID=A0A5C5WAM2_9BACT|nr:sigma-54 dependent transcriptional regulator [Botrimarina hoheduenensis]TWT47730.1 Transcriptional regulatory protein ZraR [Botrimarina hoheduenensis]